MNDIKKVLDQESSIKASVTGSKGTISQALNAELSNKKSKGFFGLAEDVAGFFMNNSRSPKGTFAKGQISDELSDIEDQWIKKKSY